MKWLVAGSRDGWDPTVVMNLLDGLVVEHGAPALVIAGGARGVDRIAETWARRRGFPVKTFRADWSSFGRSAGFRRNLRMLDERPDLVVVFNWLASPGSSHTTGEAKKRGQWVIEYKTTLLYEVVETGKPPKVRP